MRAALRKELYHPHVFDPNLLALAHQFFVESGQFGLVTPTRGSGESGTPLSVSYCELGQRNRSYDSRANLGFPALPQADRALRTIF
jgi:hypothetical protein